MAEAQSDRRPSSPISWTWVGLLVVLTLAAFLRFWEIGTNFHFMGDEGQQAQIEWQLIHGHLPLLGPSLSIGLMHLGPFFYYLAAIPLWIADGSPVGPTVMVGIFGVGAVLLLFLYLRFPLGDWPALGASAVMAASFLMVEYSRRPWNPTPTPFFTLLFLWSLVLWKRHSSRYVVMTSGSLAILLQLQPVNVFLVGLLVIFVIISKPARPSVTFLALAAALFVAISSPLIIYDLTHSFGNTQAWINGLLGRGKHVPSGPHSSSPRVLFDLFNRAFEPRALVVSILIAIAITIAALRVSFFDHDAVGANWEVLLALILLVIAAVGFEVYRKEVFEQYLVCLFPVPFIFLASFLRLLWKGRWPRVAAVIVTAALVAVGIRDVVQYTFLTPVVTAASAGATTHDLQPDDLYGHVVAVDRYIESQVGSRPFSLFLTSPFNAVYGYRYVLARAGHPPSNHGPAILIVEPPTFPVDQWTPALQPLARKATSSKTIGLAKVLEVPARR